jgi:hypothetical protein
MIGEPQASQNRASERACRPHAGQAVAALAVTSIWCTRRAPRLVGPAGGLIHEKLSWEWAGQ